jgi:hypothetical protein
MDTDNDSINGNGLHHLDDNGVLEGSDDNGESSGAGHELSSGSNNNALQFGLAEMINELRLKRSS